MDSNMGKDLLGGLMTHLMKEIGGKVKLRDEEFIGK